MLCQVHDGGSGSGESLGKAGAKTLGLKMKASRSSLGCLVNVSGCLLVRSLKNKENSREASIKSLE